MNYRALFVVFFTISIATPSFPLHAAYPLSQASKNKVILWATIGALIGSLIGYDIGRQSQDHLKEEEKSELANFLPALGMGALMATFLGLWAYYATPEKVLELTEARLAALSHTVQTNQWLIEELVRAQEEIARFARRHHHTRPISIHVHARPPYLR